MLFATTNVSFWDVALLLACLGPVIGLAVMAVIVPLRSRPVPWVKRSKAGSVSAGRDPLQMAIDADEIEWATGPGREKFRQWRSEQSEIEA